MCGIAGMLFHDRDRAVDPDVVLRMTEAIRHRGPDDGGVWTDGAVGLGSRRLAVIDLSPRGHQPMTNEDGSIWIAFNGEIYNFQALRDRLRARGHRFRSDTDTETILHLYEERGVGLLDELLGMFAFALWDGRTRSLILARDRLGKKPLFYRSDERAIAFASEVNALLQDPGLEVAVDPQAIHHYLTFGYVPSPQSAFRGVRKLPPGHVLVARDGRVEVQRYWSLRYTPKRRSSEQAADEELLALLEDAVRVRLVSDVPLGALLSGGVDSSLVVALMRRVGGDPIRTFSIGFDQPAYDELAHARAVATRFATEHHELVVQPDAVAILPRLVWHYGEPYADSSALPSFYLCEMARRSVTVALAGDGGDEVFGGYDRFVAASLAGRLDLLPRTLRSAIARGAMRMLPAAEPKSSVHRLARFLDGLPLDPAHRYARWLTVFESDAKRELYTAEFAQRVEGVDPLGLLQDAYRRSDAPGFLEATLHTDVQTYLPDDLLVKMDIASMAHSLEVRSPLLDHRIVELAASLPIEQKLRGLTTKRILRRIARGILPGEILRRPKMGFGVPIDHWFRGELREMSYDVLLDSRSTARGLFRPEAVRRLLDDHCASRAHHHHRLWSLLMLELWHRTFIDRPATVAPPRAEPSAARDPEPSSVVGRGLSL